MRRRKTQRKRFQIRLILSLLILVIFFLTGFILYPLVSSINDEDCITLQSAIENESIIISEQSIKELVSPVIEIEDERALLDKETEPIVISEQSVEELVSPVIEIEEAITLSDEEVNLIALVTMAEAEGECEEGKRLVIDTILNRVDSEHFPNTVYEVIYQPSQFSSMWNGRVDECEVREDICQLVREEVKVRTNYEVIFFTAGNYGKYGTSLFRVQNHYFSSYE